MSASLSERAFVGSLMHLSAATVIGHAGRVRQSDLEDPRLGVIYQAAVMVAASGQDPVHRLSTPTSARRG